MKSIRYALTIAMVASISALANAGLNVGSSVDSFAANDDEGNFWSLQDHIGKKNVVVYFYPAAMTGGCTKQACAYRDHSSTLNDLDAVVVGVSGDSVNNLKLFKEAHGLNFTLISDINGAIAEQFGVATRGGGSIEREIAGVAHTLDRGITTMRWTFIINKEGKVVYKDDAVKATEDTNNVLAQLKKL
jgi:peroxiredoxin Q/BCP